MKTLIKKSAHNIETSECIAKEIADILKTAGNFSVFLEGGLGAGKTFLVRTILQDLGVSVPVTSPTYTYVNEYEANGVAYAHFDFYRLDSPEAFFTKGFEEIAADPHIACFSEWVDKIPDSAQAGFSGKKFVIRVEFGVGAGMRKITFLSVF